MRGRLVAEQIAARRVIGAPLLFCALLFFVLSRQRNWLDSVNKCMSVQANARSIINFRLYVQRHLGGEACAGIAELATVSFLLATARKHNRHVRT